MKALRISSKKDGFRRAGLTHPAEAVDHPLESLEPWQVKALQNEPLLVVQEVEIPDEHEPLELEGAGEDDKGGKAKAKPQDK